MSSFAHSNKMLQEHNTAEFLLVLEPSGYFIIVLQCWSSCMLLYKFAHVALVTAMVMIVTMLPPTISDLQQCLASPKAKTR